MHLHNHILNRHLARELPPRTLAIIDSHVSNCLFCAHTLAEAGVASTLWERRGWLGRLARVERPAVAVPVDEALRAEAA